MSLSINQVINASIMPQSQSAQRRDLSIVAIFTSDICAEFQDPETRYVTVANAKDVANLFGTNSEAHKASQALFSTRPSLKKAVMARWVKDKQEIAAVPNALKGSTLTAGINVFKAITDGAMVLNVGGKDIELLNLNFSAAIDFNDVSNTIDKALPADSNITAIWDKTGFRIIIQAKTAGAYPATKIGYATSSDVGTSISSLLKLQDGQATITKGRAAITVQKELPSEALHKLENVYQNWYGVYFSDVITDEQLEDAHTWVASSEKAKIMAYTAIRDEQIEWSNENILKKLFDKNSARLMVQYNKTGDDHAAASLLGIAVSTNWNAVNSAKTVKFKQQTTVRSDDRITLNEAAKCQRLGINFYTDYDGVSMLAEGTMLGGIFIDEITGLDAFLDASQKQLFTTIQGNPSKIPQTDKGQARLIGALTVIGNEFVRNGFLAGGIWRGNEVGELIYGSRLDDGFYFYSDSYDLQSIADREERKAMPIMCAIKLAGAIHSADLLIQFNR